MKPESFITPNKPTWCPGCGNHTIWASLRGALAQLKIAPHEAVLVYGIGCSGNMADFVKTNGFHALHGRGLPVAAGIKLANHKLHVIAVLGDGDCYGEGMNHLISAGRANFDITCLVHNNMVYGLTTGQASPTSGKGYQSKSTPEGVIEEAVNPLALAISSGATFVSRGFAGDAPYLTKILTAAIRHKGFSLIDILQPCVTFNKVNTFAWYQERVYKLRGATTDKVKALERSLEWGEKIPIGIFYKEKRPAYKDQLSQIGRTPLVKQPLGKINWGKLFKEFI
jgi:2-oxoglutarate ferredoxin oxidoreductase subunit beta